MMAAHATIRIPAEWMQDENTLREYANSLSAEAMEPDDSPEGYAVKNQAAFMALQIVHEVLLPACKTLQTWKLAEFFAPKGDYAGEAWYWEAGMKEPLVRPASAIRRAPGVYWMPTGMERPQRPPHPTAEGAH